MDKTQLTRAVFAAQLSVIRYGDCANAAFGQSSARWRVIEGVTQAIEDLHELKRVLHADAKHFEADSGIADRD